LKLRVEARHRLLLVGVHRRLEVSLRPAYRSSGCAAPADLLSVRLPRSN
jgi:hypothetical protein